MLKRFTCLLFCFLVASNSALLAGSVTSGPIDLRPAPTPKPGGTGPIALPMSEDVYSFSAYAIETAVVLTSETVSGSVYVSLLGPSGIVFYTSENMSIGSELSIAVSSFPIGSYAIFVRYGSTILVGEFEIVDDRY